MVDAEMEQVSTKSAGFAQGSWTRVWKRWERTGRFCCLEGSFAIVLKRADAIWKDWPVLKCGE